MKTSGPFKTVALCGLLVLGACLSACQKTGSTSTSSPHELHVLAWVGYDEDEFLGPIQKELGVPIKVKTYVGGDQMYSLFRAAPPGTYDVVVVDAEYGRKLYSEGRLRKLSPERWSSPGLFPQFAQGEPVREGRDVYAAVVRWGALGMVYNRNYLTTAQAQDYGTLLKPEFAGKVGIFDWYLPSMGVLSKYLGHKAPYSLSTQQLAELRDVLMRLRGQVRSIHANTSEVIADLRDENVYVTPGIGEWAASARFSPNMLRTANGIPAFLLKAETREKWVAACRCGGT